MLIVHSPWTSRVHKIKENQIVALGYIPARTQLKGRNANLLRVLPKHFHRGQAH